MNRSVYQDRRFLAAMQFESNDVPDTNLIPSTSEKYNMPRRLQGENMFQLPVEL